MFDSSRIFNRKLSLRKLIRKKNWNKLRSYLRCGSKRSVQQVNDIGPFGWTILALAVYRKAPIDIIVTILNINPLLSLKPDHAGVLPIHIACNRGISSDVLEFLIAHDHGASARALENSGNSPMHNLVENICGKTLYQDECDASSMTNSASYGEQDVVMQPCSAGSSRSCNSEMSISQESFDQCLRSLEFLCASSPEMVRCPNKSGNTPVDIVQDIKFECISLSSKWERADIVYHVLRNVNIRLYLEEKKLYEFTDGKSSGVTFACNASLPSLDSSNASSFTNYS